jgi:large subunit ribosomal protein L13
MMPKNKIGRHMMSKLKLYSGTVHEHQAQSPIPLEAIDGRPTAAGAIYAPKPVPKARPARKPKPPVETPAAVVAEPVAHEPAPAPEGQLPAPAEAHEAQLPAPEPASPEAEPAAEPPAAE